MLSLEEANNLTDPSKVVFDDENLTITLEEGMSMDLGGVSKGYVSREIINYLNTLDLPAYLLNNGESNISIGGTHPIRDNGKFIIGITNPESPSEIYATSYLSDSEQLVTSGDYQKYFIVDGVKYHHIIDPSTLMPSEYSRSVSIITSDPALADLYSTAIFNMSIEDGQAFVNSIDGMEAIWFGLDGTIYYSENFEEDYLVDLY
jgi:thiamine biosynthesis lipoprotein